jgi:hypothetical protein
MTNVTRSAPAYTAVKRAIANPSTATTTQLVAAVAGKKYRVVSMVVVTTVANNINLESGTTDITAVFPLGANGGLVLDFNEHGWCETAVGEALQVTTSAATAAGVQVQYVEIQA